MRTYLSASVALELYRENVITREELRDIFGIQSAPEEVTRWKVGDIVAGREAYATVPVGTVLKSPLPLSTPITRVENGFVDNEGRIHSPATIFGTREIIDLPGL